MEDWISKDLKIYHTMFENNDPEELAINHCAMSMLKILNGLSEMNYTKFHRYEKTIIWSAMKLFSKQCIEQLNSVINYQTNVEKKRELISDIENSISEIVEVCKNIFDSTTNPEREMFQSLSIDTNTHELSPKLCAFYSCMLEKIVTLFSANGEKYAFIIHPTLRSTIEAKLLFKKREISGKVVIIYISENVLDDFNLVPVCLIHEAFHVISKEERYRKKRAIFLFLQMVLEMKRLLFQGITFSKNQVKDTKIKDTLAKIVFYDIKKQLLDLDAYPSDSKIFYSKEIKKHLCNIFKKYFVEISANADNLLPELVSQMCPEANYNVFHDKLNHIYYLIEQIRDNVAKVLLGNTISAKAELLLFIYREAYADIACILTLDLTPYQYNFAFRHSIQFKYPETYKDRNKEIREYLVAKTISNILPPNNQNGWIPSFVESCQNKLVQCNKNFDDFSGTTGHNDENYGIIDGGFSSQELQYFTQYLFCCGKALYIRLEKAECIKSFRNFMKNVNADSSNETLLINILQGNAEQLFIQKKSGGL